MLVQLNPPIPMETLKGFGYAIMLNYPSVTLGCWWCVAIAETRELWWCPNEEVRLEKSWSMWMFPGHTEIMPVPDTSRPVA